MEQIALTSGGDNAQVQSVLLLTDGLANQGITSKEQILAEMKKMQEQGLHAVSTVSEGMPTYTQPRPPQQQSQQQRGWFDFLFGRKSPQQQQVASLPVQQQQAPQLLLPDDSPQAEATGATKPTPSEAKVSV